MSFIPFQKMGAWLTTAESVILSMVGDSRLPQFKSIQALIREKSLEAGLNDTQENNPGKCKISAESLFPFCMGLQCGIKFYLTEEQYGKLCW